MDIKKQVEYFKGLPYDIKRQKVLDMLNQLQRTHETFSMFYKTVRELEHPSDDVLLYLYKSILEIAEDVSKWKKGKVEEKIKNMAEVLMKIRKEEELAREREGNPDEMLKNI